MKYPRTPHLPFSPGLSKQEKVCKNLSFLKQDVVITEKRDGSNVCLADTGLFARSHSGSPTHSSFDWLKVKYDCVKSLIPEDTFIFGEWLYAKHSIHYTALKDYLEVFAVCTNNTFLSWEDTEKFCTDRNFMMVPFIFKGRTTIKDIAKYCVGNEHKEGIVVRAARSFSLEEFSSCVAKWVRPNHVQTTEHWTNQKITRNLLV